MGKYQIFLIGRDTLAYEIKTLGNISINKNTPISPMPLPEEDSSENMLIKIEGNSTTMNVSWTLIEANDVVGNNTFTHNGDEWVVGNPDSSISTSIDQLQWLETTFAPNSLNDFYKILILDSAVSSSSNAAKIYEKDGIFQGFNFTTDSSSPVIWNASFDFIEGSVISTLSGNTHEQPTITAKSFATSSGTRYGITVDFKEFQNYLSNDRPTTTGAILRYKLATGVQFWREKEIVLTANTTSPYNYTQTFNLSDIEQSGNYKIKLSLVTDGGRGEWSIEHTVT